MSVQRFTVLGARGFVGSRLTQTLRDQRRDVLAFGRGDESTSPIQAILRPADSTAIRQIS